MLTGDDARRMAAQQSISRAHDRLTQLIRLMEDNEVERRTILLELKYIVDFILRKGD